MLPSAIYLYWGSASDPEVFMNMVHNKKVIKVLAIVTFFVWVVLQNVKVRKDHFLKNSLYFAKNWY